MAEYVHQCGIANKPAFNYWDPHLLKKHGAIIYLVKNRNPHYLKRTHKFGVDLPKFVSDAHAIDKKNGNTFWAGGITKEMKNVWVAFDVVPDGHRIPQNYQFFHCHIIYNAKMEDFHHKARYAAVEHMKNPLPTITYAIVVGRETVRIALTLTALNGLEVNAGDIKNVYVTAPVTEKIWTKLGEEFRADTVKMAIIVQTLYGLKYSGATFRNHMADCIRHMGYASCLAEPDL